MINRRHLFGASGAALALSGLAVKASAATPSSLSPQILAPQILNQARAALNRHQDKVKNLDRMAIADFSLKSATPRFHILDLKTLQAQSFLVAHGKGSDPAHTGWLTRFSNAPGSEATSEGAYLTADTYTGKHGLSRRLIGLDPQNSNALSRAIVIHSAWYVNDDMARAGALGRSQGCFALSERDHATIMDLMGPDRLIVALKT